MSWRAAILAVCVAVSGCAGETGSACERAADLLAECTGRTAPEDAFGECTAEEARAAEAILEAGCDAVTADAKADGAFCTGFSGFLLRKLGLCALDLLFPDPVVRQKQLAQELGRGTATLPIVLHHGFAAGPDNGWGFVGVPQALGGEGSSECGPAPLHASCFERGGDGHAVYFGTVPPFERVEQRAAALAQHIDAARAKFGAPKVHLITMSLGGLDARHAISVLGLGDRVASLTTLHGEHHGTRVADAALKLVGASDGKLLERALNDLARSWGLSFNPDSTSSDLLGILQDLSEARAPEFNRTHPNDPRVQYRAWAAVSRTPGQSFDEARAIAACGGDALSHWHRDTWAVTRPEFHALAFFAGHELEFVINDGIATVQTARGFPHPEPAANGPNFEFRGCVPGDHQDLMNSDRPDAETGFDHVRFIRNVALDLVELESEHGL